MPTIQTRQTNVLAEHTAIPNHVSWPETSHSYEPPYHGDVDRHSSDLPEGEKHSLVPRRKKRRFYSVTQIQPLSLIILLIWIAFAIVLIWLLEKAVASGPRSVSPPWSLTTLPSLLLTIFAQGHTAVTAMHLARIAVSALQSESSIPRTWRELFWMADRSWQGPVGMIVTVYDCLRFRTTTSFTYILFCLTCVVALVTPAILTRAYPVRSVSVAQDIQIRPSTVAFNKMELLGGNLQIGASMGAWSTGLTILDVYGTSSFTPQNVPRVGNPDDSFFAGDVNNATSTLPGLRLQGQCVPVNAPGQDLSNTTTFRSFCLSKVPGMQTPEAQQNYTAGGATLSLSACNNGTWDVPVNLTRGSMSANVAFVFYNYSGRGGSGSGLIQCDSRMSTGKAVASGTGRTYTSFSLEPLFNVSAATGGEPILDPLFAALFYLTDSFAQTSENDFALSGAVQGLGFQSEDSSERRNAPSAGDIAGNLWRAVSHVVGGTAALSKDNGTSYPATVMKTVSVHTRLSSFAIAAYVLLAVWLLLLLALTAWSYRLTFSYNLNSYVASRLLLDRMDLVVDTPVGDVETNEKLGEAFQPVGKDGMRRY